MTEVWQKQENKKHQFKLEKLLEMQGIQYISTPRPGPKRGGGASIAVRLEKFTLSKLNICIPRCLEIVWGILKPKIVTGKITTIILCCFYSPPRSKKNRELLDHLTVTLQSLLNVHKNAGVIISGDRNNLEISSLISIDPSLRQIVSENTRGSKILDVIITNLGRYYNPPIIIPPVMPDLPGHGVPSEHSGVCVSPRDNQARLIKYQKVKKMIRPIPESLITKFHIKLSALDFDVLHDLPVCEMVDVFHAWTSEILAQTFPEKQISISPYDVPWFSEELRLVKRQRQRYYTKHGKDQKYEELKTKFDDKLKKAKLKYKMKIESEVIEGKRGSSYPVGWVKN